MHAESPERQSMNANDPIVLPVGAEPPDLDTLSVFFIGTATVLIRYAGFTILTDPNFLHRGQKAHLGYGLRSTRLTDPALTIDELPPLDLVLLSHMHGDHWDEVADRRLDRRLPIVTTPHAAAVLAHRGFASAHALRTWEALAVRKGAVGLRVTSMPGRHGPGALSLLLPPVMGSMLEFDPGDAAAPLRLYISGDTLVFDQLREIPRRFSGIDLALLHLGGTRIGGVLLTMDAAQGLEAMRIVNPAQVVPIHYNDYRVFRSPLEDFRRAVDAAGLGDRVHYLEHGETYSLHVARAPRAVEEHPPAEPQVHSIPPSEDWPREPRRESRV